MFLNQGSPPLGPRWLGGDQRSEHRGSLVQAPRPQPRPGHHRQQERRGTDRRRRQRAARAREYNFERAILYFSKYRYVLFQFSFYRNFVLLIF